MTDTELRERLAQIEHLLLNVLARQREHMELQHGQGLAFACFAKAEGRVKEAESNADGELNI